MSDVTYRPMTEADLDQVVELERLAFSHPWSRKLYADALTSYQCWVVEDNGVHVGHGVLQLILDEAHLLNIAVAPKSQGQGLGYALLDFLMAKATAQGANECFLELRESNQSAYRLYERYGFNEVGRRRNYYPAAHGKEDALIMVCPLFA